MVIYGNLSCIITFFIEKTKITLDNCFFFLYSSLQFYQKGYIMKVRSSLKTAKMRDKNCKIVRRKGRVYVINKLKPKLKARQG